jgi:hypothetical protein
MSGTNVVALKSGGQIAGIVPQSIEEVFRLAQAVHISGLAPRDLNTPEKITVAVMTGLELGLPPMFSLNKIAVINGRPTLWGDALPGLLWSRGFKIREWIADEIAHCEVTRPDGEKIVRTFSPADAQKAGLKDKAGPWKQYPTRMLQMRARGFACRDGAADVLGGLYIREELEDVVDITPDAPKRKSSNSAKKDGTDKVFNSIIEEIRNAKNSVELEAIRETHMETWDTLPSRWAELLTFEYDDRMALFQNPPAETEAAE